MQKSTHSNSIMVLRERELARTTKPFRARGSKVQRCPECLLHKDGCICAARPPAYSGSAFLFIMYTGEAFKPSNTGRLVADVVCDNHAFVWDRTRPDPALLSLLQDERYAPVLIFPAQYAEPERCINSPEEASGIRAGKIPLYIMLDGTWREAKKMFKSPCLSTFPVLGVNPEHVSNYQLREAAHDYQLCTAEVAALVLALGGEEETAKALTDYFEIFRRNYIAGKPHMVFREESRTAMLTAEQETDRTGLASQT